jgi:hypothetical protein
MGPDEADEHALAAAMNREISRYLFPPTLNTARSLANISALRNISLTSVGFDHSAALTTWTQVLNGGSASDRPGRCQNSRKVLTAIIRNARARHP